MMFNGKTALVTGSTSGIGLGIARGLAAQGANVILNGFGEPGSIEQLRAELAERYGVQVRYDGADMSQPEAIEAMTRHHLASPCASLKERLRLWPKSRQRCSATRQPSCLAIATVSSSLPVSTTRI